jgi:hypothetical protein
MYLTAISYHGNFLLVEGRGHIHNFNDHLYKGKQCLFFSLKLDPNKWPAFFLSGSVLFKKHIELHMPGFFLLKPHARLLKWMAVSSSVFE